MGSWEYDEPAEAAEVDEWGGTWFCDECDDDGTADASNDEGVLDEY